MRRCEMHAIIFDLDGTLLDTVRDLAESMDASLSEAGFPGHTLDEYTRMIGSGLRSLIALALPPLSRDDKTVDRVLRIMKRIYPARMTVHTRPYPGIPDLLDKVEKLGIPKAILSNKPDEMTQVVVAELLGKWSFHPVIGSSPRFPKKPDPASALHIARALGAAPEETVFVGDSGIDMENALRAGMIPVGVSWGYGKREELDRHGVRAIATTPREVADLIVGLA
jgi:phosphoglycolate phosphatase